ncbi:MAG: hypothetical protein A2W72_09060 [Burkholderiales bacterium RIFCSPLOWO2_12_67_14]|nr:MAG: hypothetical protein A3I64_14685 [Burkholderiales bacterium RIFCSPLOWO2_02_FULL_67_64]OGB40088.1 MAG: hypothetical protein A2W72_09060 [Burkholderiales bacterium RIFCSPLOWO2_12_67_14]OGB49765.1 MAG: hypothetical protein A3E51_18675 [Burkholderiales bacterium RIFCSPHIGHO2_12_FULL_67_38]OGB82696.1 MAG: hypothetical protein A3G82_09110 [Burkholderiales bacterium RIFCSPLOWO2_12_FULL_67_210]
MLLLLVSTWGFMLVIHGAVPFLLTPTLGQAVWSTGFSQSFVNQSLWTVYATNFGAPEPAAMAFGLPGAWLTALYIQLGLQPPDAYSAMVASWMTLAMVSAYAMARHFSVKPALAVLAALGWMSMPVTWAHASYSMLSIGIALLPMYLLCSLKLLQQCAPDGDEPAHRQPLWKLTYPLVCILAVFMDGYSFMFFAMGASLFGAWWWLKADSIGRRRLALVALPLHALSLLAAYLLYSTFVGKSGYAPASLDFFRSWGADLTFFAWPTLGMHWLPDALGWSVARSDRRYFGDSSVWVTTFSIPVVVGCIWAAWRMAGTQKAVTGLLVIALFGFYMALGPSLKLNSVKPQDANADRLMLAEEALASTGSGILSEKLPGFNNMRASYRWTALGVFGAWGVLLLALSTRNQPGSRRFAIALMIGVILLNLPDIPKKWTRDVHNRSMFLQIERELVDDMRQVLHAKERVAFLPYRNDFLANYLAARLDIVSFNIGGDKNLEKAREHWPYWMGEFRHGQIDPRFTSRVAMLLASGQADSVVFPYSDMLWAAHKWPYPHEFKDQLRSIAQTLQHLDVFEISTREHYTALRLKQEYLNWPKTELMGRILLIACAASPCQKTVESGEAPYTMHTFLTEGWSAPEPWGQWSTGQSANVLLNIGAHSHSDLELQITGQAFLIPGKLDQQQVDVFLGEKNLGQLNYALPDGATPSTKTIHLPRNLLSDLTVKGESWVMLTFQFRKPKSPAELGISGDPRPLALGLMSLALREKSISTPSR